MKNWSKNLNWCNKEIKSICQLVKLVKPKSVNHRLF